MSSMPRTWWLWCCLGVAFSPAAGQDSPRGSQPSASASPATTAPEPAEEDRREEELAAGHSYHGEAFNEGPRQRAYLLGGTGEVHFPCSTQNPEVQAFIDQGVGQLHGFWYYEAERSFRQAAMLDPDCAIAYWGMAMANVNNAHRAKGFIAEAVKRKNHAGRREQLYIDALNAFHNADAQGEGDKKRREALVKAYEQILHEFPNDIEAKAFLGLQLYDNRGKGLPIYSYFAVDALLRDVLAVNPRHPCHHYVIHLWDYEKPARALESSALCGPAAPAIAHMWHMPGHIYSRLKRYHDAVWQQEASARVDHAHMIRDRVMPDQIHNFAHNNEWLIRNLVFIGRAHAALDLAKNMIDLPRHPAYNTPAKKGSAYYGRLRLVQVLNDFEWWDEVLRLEGTRYLEPPSKPDEILERQRLIARAHLRSGDVEGAQPLLAELRTRRERLEAEQDEAVARAERILKSVGKSPSEIDEMQKQEREKYEKVLKPLRETLHELDGLEHLALGRFAEALESLKQAGSQPAPLMALVHLRAGQVEEGLKLIAKEVRGRENQTIPLAHQVYLLHEAGKTAEARQAFEKLRAISETIDLDIPLFARLTPIAAEFGWPSDWRLPLEPRNDLGERPDLDSLGPFRWQPPQAPDWSLRDHLGQTWSLGRFRGKPVVVIFYLGQGCLHCTEQLQKFAPEVESFRQAGLELIAISTDPPEALKQSVELFENSEFAFPLVENHALDVFRAYRCYDDFEQKPLHGTFLIDGEGRIRWQDISYEPFMQPRFVLAEARRLLTDGPLDPDAAADAAGDPGNEKSDAPAGETNGESPATNGGEETSKN